MRCYYFISIINDIPDFSKIESGKMKIIPVNYMFPSLANDTVNIIRMRLIEKPIRFYTNIEEAMPNGLTGDETRIRQIKVLPLPYSLSTEISPPIASIIPQVVHSSEPFAVIEEP